LFRHHEEPPRVNQIRDYPLALFPFREFHVEKSQAPFLVISNRLLYGRNNVTR
jgi:hypothetical protein